jgi:hypothetical protein
MFRALEGIEGMIVEFVREGVGEASKSPVVSVVGESDFFPDVAALTARRGEVDEAELRWYSSAMEARQRGLHAGGGGGSSLRHNPRLTKGARSRCYLSGNGAGPIATACRRGRTLR